ADLRAVVVGPVAGGRAGAAGVDVLDQDGAGGGAVALPQLVAGRGGAGREEQRPVHVGQVAGVRAVRGIEVPIVGVVPRSSREDVLDQDGAGLGAVALPQLPGGEEQRAVHVGQVGDIARFD